MDFLTGVKLGFDLFLSIFTAEPMLTLVFVIFFVGTVVLTFIVSFLRQQKLKKSGILEVDKMNGKVFEEYLQVLLRNKGYKVNLTSVTGDYGADLVLSNNEKKNCRAGQEVQKESWLEGRSRGCIC
jgi:restriction system protein